MRSSCMIGAKTYHRSGEGENVFGFDIEDSLGIMQVSPSIQYDVYLIGVDLHGHLHLGATLRRNLEGDFPWF